MTPKQLADLSAQWRRALLATNEGHWLQSEVAVAVVRECGLEKAVAYKVFGRIGVSPNAKTKLWAMNAARSVVGDKDIWLAAGWDRVRALVGMGEKERAAKIKAIRRDIAAGAKPRKAAAKALPRPSPRRRHTVTAHERGEGLLEKAIADIARLAAFNPATLPLLSPEVREAVEARMSTEAA